MSRWDGATTINSGCSPLSSALELHSNIALPQEKKLEALRGFSA